MSYNKKNPPYLTTAGKITVFTSFIGAVAFMLIFLLNIGQSEFQSAVAQSNATTSVNVLNTPPDWTVDAEESPESSTLYPTNSGDVLSWTATANDSNGAPYFLLICSSAASPTANANVGTPGTAAPTCDGGISNQWAVSTGTVNNLEATAATTTLEAFSESNIWYAWVCDDDSVNPRCNDAFRQGSGTTSSPFIVNHRPTFSLYSDTSPADPGAVIFFQSTSTDPDSDGGADTVQLVVCFEADYDNSTNTCGIGGVLATSTFGTTDVAAAYTLPAVIQDQNYTAFGYIVDEHGHEALGAPQADDAVMTVNNVAPTIDGSQISLNGGDNIQLVTAAGETTGYILSFVANDANSCENASTDDEITGYNVSVFRSGIGSTTCDSTAAGYDPNNCYSSGVATTTWNISCTASSTPSDCSGALDSSQTWDCTFPLWYVSDPTDGAATTSFYNAEDWRAAVSASDDDAATGPFVESTTAGIELLGLLAFDLNTLAIPYGDLAPGDNTVNLIATTTASSTGNVGVDTDLSGVRMCPTGFGIGACPATATSSIPETEQQYGTSSLPYDGGGASLSTTDVLLDLNVAKPTATSSQPAQNTFWGIEVPGTVTLAGIYTGRNTISAVQSNPSQW